MPRVLTEPVDQKNTEQREAEEREEYERERRRQYHERIVNGGQPVDRSMLHSEWQRQQRGEPQLPPQPEQPPQPTRSFPRGGGNFAILPGNMRGGLPRR